MAKPKTLACCKLLRCNWVNDLKCLVPNPMLADCMQTRVLDGGAWYSHHDWQMQTWNMHTTPLIGQMLHTLKPPCAVTDMRVSCCPSRLLINASASTSCQQQPQFMLIYATRGATWQAAGLYLALLTEADLERIRLQISWDFTL